MFNWLAWIWHRLCFHTKHQCNTRRCGGQWVRWEGVNPIHVEGPPLWFDSYCTKCGALQKSLSSNLMEGAAWRSVQHGTITEDEAAKALAKILPRKVLEDTYEVHAAKLEN